MKDRIIICGIAPCLEEDLAQINCLELCACGCGLPVNPGKRFIHGHNACKKSWEPLSLPQPCACGCGQETKPGNTYIHNHHNRNTHFTEDHKEKLRQSNVGQKRSIEAVENNRKAQTGKKASEETRAKMSVARKGKVFTEEHIEKLKISSKKRYLNVEYLINLSKGLNIRPNKPETIILNLLEELYPGHWKYSGDYTFWINGKNPDFVNINGQKKLIELFGDYWHQGEDPQDRINVFKPYGWDTLVIWEKELKRISNVKMRIHKFMRKQHE